MPRSRALAPLLAALAACVSADYTPPPGASAPDPYGAEIDRPYDAVWDSLLARAERESWQVAISERAIGLLTLSFLAPDLAVYADCGQVRLDSPERKFEGPFAVYVRDYGQGGLRVEAEIRASKLDGGATRVAVKARYGLSAVAEGSRMEGRRVAEGGYSWQFSTGGSHTLEVEDSLTGRSYERTCEPTYAFERSVLDAAHGN